MLCDNFGLFCYFGSMYEKAKIHLQNSSLSTSNFEGPTLYSRKIFFWGGGEGGLQNIKIENKNLS